MVALVALAAVCAFGVIPSSSQAQGPACRSLRVIFYTSSDWMLLAEALAADPSACADYYISIPPPAADKTEMRSGVAPAIRALGPNFHALAEVNVAAWQAWVTSTGNSWYDAGVEARSEMVAAGFDATAGDSWFVNEVSSAVRQGTGATRQNIEALLQGLYQGDGSEPTQGVVAVEGVGQPTDPLTVYKANLESWLEDPGFWTTISPDVSDFLQETYGDIRDYAVAGADVPTRISYLNEYLEDELALSTAAPPGASAAQSFLESTYAPLANAAWAWSGDYGFTDESAADMEDYIAAQIDAMRSYDSSLGWSGDRIGFAWAPSNGLDESASDFAGDESSILSQLAAAIDASADPSAPGAGACQSPWCSAVVPGAAFVPGWSAFSSWTPTTVEFASPAVSVAGGSPSAAVTLAREIGDVVTALPIATDGVVSSSSSSGTFSTSPQGPWSPTLEVTIPAGSTSSTIYMLDPQQGTPTLSVVRGGQTARQVETVTAPAAVISSVAPLSGDPGTTVTIIGGGFAGATAVSFDGTPASFTIVSASELTATVPVGAGNGPVAVTTPAGTATSTASFEVSPLSISTSTAAPTVDEGAAAAPLDPALTITDSSSATLTGATVTISSGYTTGDALSASTAGTPITASYAADVLTLGGDAPIADYVSVLANVAFTSTSSVSGPRSITWEAEDAGGANGQATSSFSFLALPEAPANVSATVSDGQATVSFTPGPATSDTPTTSYYTVTASPGGATATGPASPITLTGLSAGTSYSFTVAATSALGTGPASEASNTVTPTVPTPLASSSGGGAGGGGGGSDLISVSLSPPSQTVPAGGTASWTVTVTNTGGNYVGDVEVSDGPVPGCSQTSGQSARLYSMAPTVSVSYSCSAGVSGDMTNTVNASAVGPAGDTVTASASATVTVTGVAGVPPPVAKTPSHAPKVTQTRSTLAALTLAPLRVVLLERAKPSVRLTAKLSKATVLTLLLVDSKGKTLARWSYHAKAGSNTITLLLPRDVRKAGHDRLTVSQTGAKKPLIEPITFRA